MPKHVEMEQQLEGAILGGKTDVALYVTCQYLQKHLHSELEEIFIHLCAKVGEHPSLPFVSTWSHVCEKLHNLIENDECHISEVLSMTTMICLLHKRLSIENNASEKARKRTQIKKEILEYFPEKARLSYRGMEVFERIIPKEPEDLNSFVHRLLAGFMRLLEQKQSHEIFQSLVYLSKRRIQLPLPTPWPAPDEENAKQGDPIWLLWGMLLLYFRSPNVATNWRLFCHNFKKKHKVQRLGLLYGISFQIKVATNSNSSNSLLWTPQEELTLQKIKEIAPALWADFLDQHKKEIEEEPEEENPLTYFEPRGTCVQQEPPMHAYMLPRISPVKSIDLSPRNQTRSDLRGKHTRIKKVE